VDARVDCDWNAAVAAKTAPGRKGSREHALLLNAYGVAKELSFMLDVELLAFAASMGGRKLG
jgi:hypothetical protein